MAQPGDPHIDFDGEIKDVDVSPEAPDPTADLGLNGRSPQHDVEVEQDMVALANQSYQDPDTWPEMNNPEYEVTVLNREGHLGAVIFDKASGELRVVFRGTDSARDVKEDLGFTVEAADEEKAHYGGHTPTLGAADTFGAMWDATDDEPGLEEVLQEYADSGHVTSMSVSGHSLGGAMAQMLLERSDEDGNNMLEKMGFDTGKIKAATYGAPTAFVEAPDDDNPWHVPPMFHAYQLDWDIVVHMAQNWADVTKQSDFNDFLNVIPAMLKAMGMSTEGFIEGEYVNYGDSAHGGRANDGSIVRLQPEPGSQFVNFMKEFANWLGKSILGGAAAPFPFYHMMAWYEPAVSRAIFQGYNRDHSQDGAFKKAIAHMSDQVMSNVLGDKTTQWLMNALRTKLALMLGEGAANALIFLKDVVSGDYRLMKKLGIAGGWVLKVGRKVSAGSMRFLRAMNEWEFVQWTKTVSKPYLMKVLRGVQKAYLAARGAMTDAMPDVFKMTLEEFADSKITAEQLLKAASEAEAKQHLIFADEVTRAKYDEHFNRTTIEHGIDIDTWEQFESMADDEAQPKAIRKESWRRFDDVIARDGLEAMEKNSELPVGERLSEEELFKEYILDKDPDAAALIADPDNARDWAKYKKSYGKGWQKAKDKYESRGGTGYDEARFRENLRASAKEQRLAEIEGRATDRRGLVWEAEDLSKMESFWNKYTILRRGPTALASERFTSIFEDVVKRAETLAARMGEELGPFFKAFAASCKFLAFSTRMIFSATKLVGRGIKIGLRIMKIAVLTLGNVFNLAGAATFALAQTLVEYGVKGFMYIEQNWRRGFETMKQLFRGNLNLFQRLGEFMKGKANSFREAVQALMDWGKWQKGLQRFVQGMTSMVRGASRSVSGYFKTMWNGSDKTWGRLLVESTIADAKAGSYGLHGGGFDPATYSKSAEEMDMAAKEARTAYEVAYARWSNKWLGVESMAEGAKNVIESDRYRAFRGRDEFKETRLFREIDDWILDIEADEYSFAKNLTTKAELAEEFEPQLRKVYQAFDEKLGVFMTEDEIAATAASQEWAEAGMKFEMFMEMGKLDPIMMKAFLRNEIFRIGPNGEIYINTRTFIGKTWKEYLLAGGKRKAKLFYKALRSGMKSQRSVTWDRPMPEPTMEAELAWNAEVKAVGAEINKFEAAQKAADAYAEKMKEFNEWLEDDAVWGEDAYPDGRPGFDEDAKEEGDLQDEKVAEEDPFAPEQEDGGVEETKGEAAEVEAEVPVEMEAEVTPTEIGHAASDTEAMKAHLGENEKSFGQQMEKELGGWDVGWDGVGKKVISDAAKEAWLRDRLVMNGFEPEAVRGMSSADIMMTQVLSDSACWRTFTTLKSLVGNTLEFAGSPVGNGIIISIVMMVRIGNEAKKKDVSWGAAAESIGKDMLADASGKAREGVTDAEWAEMSNEQHVALKLTAMSEYIGMGAMVLGAGAAVAGASITGIGFLGVGPALGGVVFGETTGLAAVGAVFASLATIAFAVSFAMIMVAFIYGTIAATKQIRKAQDNQIKALADYGYATGGDHDYNKMWGWMGDYGDKTTMDVVDDPDANETAKGLNMVAQQAFGVDMDVFLQLDLQNEYYQSTAERHVPVGGIATEVIDEEANKHFHDNLHTHTGNMTGNINRYEHSEGTTNRNAQTWNAQNVWLFRMPQLLMAQAEAQNWLKKRAMSHPNEKGIPWYLGSDIQPIKYKLDADGNTIEKDGQPETELIHDFTAANWEEWCTYRPRPDTNDPSGENYATMKQVIMNNASDMFHKSDIEQGMPQEKKISDLAEELGITGGATDYSGDYGEDDYQGTGTDYRYGNLGTAFLEADNTLAEDEAEDMRQWQVRLAGDELEANYGWGSAFSNHVRAFVTDEMMLGTRGSMLQYVRHSAADPTAKYQSQQFIMYMATEYETYVTQTTKPPPEEALEGIERPTSVLDDVLPTGPLGHLEGPTPHQEIPTPATLEEWFTMSVDPNTGSASETGVPRWQTVDIKFSDTYGGYDIITQIGSTANPEGVSRNEYVSNMVFRNAVLSGFNETYVGQLNAYLKTQVWTPLYEVEHSEYDEQVAKNEIPILTNIAQVPEEFRAVMGLLAFMPPEARSLFGQHFQLVTAMFLGGKHAIVEEYTKILEDSGVVMRDRDGNVLSQYTPEAIGGLVDEWVQTAVDNKATGLTPEELQSDEYERYIHTTGAGEAVDWDWLLEYEKEHPEKTPLEALDWATSGEDGTYDPDSKDVPATTPYGQKTADERYEHDHKGHGHKRRKLETGYAASVAEEPEQERRPLGEDPATWSPSKTEEPETETPEKAELDWNRVFLMGGGFEAFLDSKYVIASLESKGVVVDYEAFYPLVLEIQKGQDAEWEGQDEAYWLGDLAEKHREIFMGDSYAAWMSTFINEGGDDGTSGDDDRGPSIPIPVLPPGSDDAFERWMEENEYNFDDKQRWLNAHSNEPSDAFHPHDLRIRQEAPNVYHPPHGPSVTSVVRDWQNSAMNGDTDPTKVFASMMGMAIDEEII